MKFGSQLKRHWIDCDRHEAGTPITNQGDVPVSLAFIEPERVSSGGALPAVSGKQIWLRAYDSWHDADFAAFTPRTLQPGKTVTVSKADAGKLLIAASPDGDGTLCVGADR